MGSDVVETQDEGLQTQPEPHWDVDSWETEGITIDNAAPWWILGMWILYFVWSIIYIFNGSSQW